MNRHPSLFVFFISAVLTIRRLEKNVFYMFFPLQSAVLSLKIIVFGICKWEFVRYLTPANNKERYSIRTFYVHLKKKTFFSEFFVEVEFLHFLHSSDDLRIREINMIRSGEAKSHHLYPASTPLPSWTWWSVWSVKLLKQGCLTQVKLLKQGWQLSWDGSLTVFEKGI